MAGDDKQILRLMVDNKNAFRDLGIRRIGLFGSFVRGEQTDTSDVDLLVDFLPGRKTYRNLLGTADLAERLMGRDVEIVTIQSLSPYIVPFVEKEVRYVQVA